jgi:5-methylcytosine-specific restriction endonuclease McrA
MRSIETKFYKSRAWVTTRSLYLDKVNHLCERCQAEGRITPARFVHHKIYLTEANYKDPRVSLNFDNLEALCADHHNAEHFGEKKIVRWRFEGGELVTND